MKSITQSPGPIFACCRTYASVCSLFRQN